MRRTQGIAALTAILVLGLVASVTAVMLTRTFNEVRNTGDDAGIIQTLMLARGTANLAGAVLQGPVRGLLNAIVEDQSSATERWSFGTSTPSAGVPSTDSVAQALSGGSGSVAYRLQAQLDALLCDADLPDVGADASIALRIHVTPTACGSALPNGVELPEGRFVSGQARDGDGAISDQTYALPFVIVAEGSSGAYRRSIASYGELQFLVGRSSFSRYALFTGEQQTKSGTPIWFTGSTLFDGPIHTNEQFAFFGQPWFGGAVTSSGCVRAGQEDCLNVPGRDQASGATFYGYGFMDVSRMRPPSSPWAWNRYGYHAPTFAGGVDWDASFIPLPDENGVEERSREDEATLSVDGDVESLVLYVSPSDGGGGGSNAYQYLEITAPDTLWAGDDLPHEDVYRFRWQGADGPNAAFTVWREDCVEIVDEIVCFWEEEASTRAFSLFVDGEVERLRGPVRDPVGSEDPDDAAPAIASFAQVTLIAEDDVRITGDLMYQDPPCSSSPVREADGTVTPAECSNLDADNLLGVYARSGDVLVGNAHWYDETLNAPYDVTVHSVLMSRDGEVAVENYDRGAPRGTMNLLGGVIARYYGGFGLFNASTGRNISGYGRAFTFDPRGLQGIAPPNFPTVNEDGVRSILVFTYGQREQVE